MQAKQIPLRRASLRQVFAGRISALIFLLFFCAPPLFLLCQSAGASPFRGKTLVVSGASPYLPSIARRIHQKGGSLADVAVALSFSLTVTHPYYISLGGGGFALVKIGDQVTAFDFRETAPQKMSPDFYARTGLSSRTGGAAAGVPGFVAGMEALHKKYGRLSWGKLLSPSVRLAEAGFPVSGDFWRETSQAAESFNPAGASLFLPKNGKPPLPGDRFRQPAFAKALKLLQKKGGKAFYKGAIGEDVLQTVQKNKGLMTAEDLKSYKARKLQPVVFPFQSRTVYSMPLPSSGGIILSRALALAERMEKPPLNSAEELHLLAEIIARAFRPRSLMGDYSDENRPPDISQWLDKKALDKLSASVLKRKSRPLPPLKDRPLFPESEDTTHFSLMDHKGDGIAVTLTLNGSYGSYLVTDHFHVVLNNQMDDFSAHRGEANMFGLTQGRNNEVRGGFRPLSSMTPVIVTKRNPALKAPFPGGAPRRGAPRNGLQAKPGAAVLVAGGAGGPAIITGVFQTLFRYFINGLNIQEAVNFPRIHHQFLPRSLFMEDKRFSPEIIGRLKAKGHTIVFRRSIGRVFAVSRGRDGFLHGGHDLRREGASGGY